MNNAERKSAYKNLRKSAEQYRLMVDHAMDGFFLHDAKGKIIDVNEQACKSLGYKYDELLKLNVSDIEAGFEPEKLLKIWKKTLESGGTTLHGVHRRKDGATFPVEIHTSVFEFEGEKLLLAIASDISERKHEEEKLEKYREQLEDLVKERELEAKAVNLRLKQDIIQRERVEEELRKSEERFRTVVDNIGVGVALINPEMQILSLNKQMKRWFPGIDIAQKPVCYKSFNRPPRRQKCTYCPTCKTLEDGLVHEAITETPQKGRIINYRIVSSPLKDKDGRIIAAIEMVDDITANLRMETALQKSIDRFNEVAAVAGEFIWEINKEGLYTYASPAVKYILGYEPEELVGKKYYYDLFLPEERERIKRETFAIMHRKQSVRKFLNAVLHKNGEVVMLATSGLPILDNDNNFIGYRGVDTDTTEQKQANDAILKLNECFLKFGPDSKKNIELIVKTAGSILNGTCALYNMIKADLLCTMFDWRGPCDLKRTDKAGGYICYDVIKMGKLEPFIVRNLDKSRYSRTDCNVKKYGLKTYIGQVVMLENRPGGSLCVLYDTDKEFKPYELKIISLLSKALTVEEERRKSQEILDKTRAELMQSEKFSALGKFASGVAHEVKNPLGIIISGIEFLERKTSCSDSQVQTALLKIRESALRADKILESLLKSAKVGYLKLSEVNPNTVLNEAVSLVGYKLAGKSIDITTRFSKEKMCIRIDQGQFQQVLLNLFFNAIDAIHTKGKITISTSKSVKPEVLSGWPACIIEITDTGEGISPDDLIKVFDPFFTTKVARKGTGLGLTISKAIIEKLSGRIEISSQKGKGTTVKIMLPLCTGKNEGR